MGKSSTPNLDAELMMCWIFNCDRIQLLLRGEHAMQSDDEVRFFEVISQRRAGKPVQYIVGQQEFMGMAFLVDERVLIPRPDTEILVETAVENLKGKESPRILDLCTGSGAIAISLSHFLPTARVVGTDISEEALEVAAYNGQRLLSSCAITWKQGDLYEALDESLELYDGIVSNPPYIATSIIETLENNVKDFEPLGALDGGEKGLDFYPVIIRGSLCRLAPQGILAVEIGWDQGASVSQIIRDSGGFSEPEIIRDLAGRDRVVLARRLGL